MSRSGKGGMQTAGLHYSIICPKCGRPAARVEPGEEKSRYLHFTRKGSVWHEVARREREEHDRRPPEQ